MTEQPMADSVTQGESDQRVFDLYDEYCHGRIDRREFLLRAAALTAGGLAMAQALLPRYAGAQTISFTDPRMEAQSVNYPSPGGNSGSMRGYLVQPSGSGPVAAVARRPADRVSRVPGLTAYPGAARRPPPWSKLPPATVYAGYALHPPGARARLSR